MEFGFGDGILILLTDAIKDALKGNFLHQSVACSSAQGNCIPLKDIIERYNEWPVEYRLFSNHIVCGRKNTHRDIERLVAKSFFERHER